MAERNEQEKPLAPAPRSVVAVYKQSNFQAEFLSRRHQKCIKCWGCLAAVLLILVFTTLILMLTVLHVKDPVLKLNSVKMDGLDLLSGNDTSFTGLNLTLEADVSVKNSNAASFKFDSARTMMYYGGSVVGEVRTPAGRVEARKTVWMNVSVDVMVDKLLEVGRFSSDLRAGVLPFSTYTMIDGKVKIKDVIKRSVDLKMNCTMNVNVSSQAIQDKNCRRSVS